MLGCVLFAGYRPQMTRSDTRGIVALVMNDQPIGNWAEDVFVGKAMNVNKLAFISHMPMTSLTICGPNPYPAISADLHAVSNPCGQDR